MRSSFFLIVTSLAVLCSPPARAQSPGEVNLVDSLGRKQGTWRILAPKEDRPGYADGQLIEEGSYTNNKRVGLWKRYWPSGKVMSEIHYQMGRPRGDYKTYYSDGKVEEQGSWDLDRNVGGFKRWHANGQLAQDFVFSANGLRNGVQRYYHENGQLEVEVNIKDGQEEGTLKRYYANGDLQQVAQFNDGDLNEATSRYLKPAHAVVEPKPEAGAKPAPTPSVEERPNASLFQDNGFNTLYDKQLRLSQVGEFRNGKLFNGKFYRYDRSSGELMKIEVFVDGRYTGNAVLTDEDKAR